MTQYFIEMPDGGGPVAFDISDSYIGDGGEAHVYPFPLDPAYCVKIYSPDKRPADMGERIAALGCLAEQGWNVDGHPTFAYPLALVLDSSGAAAGFIMPRMRAGFSKFQEHLFEVTSGVRGGGLVNYSHFVDFATDLARVVSKLHERGFVVGDLSHENLLAHRVRRRVTFVDVDSFLFTGSDGRRFVSNMWRAETSAPELLAGTTSSPTRQSDKFALATVVSEILLGGFSPFFGTRPEDPEDDDESNLRNIAEGRSWILPEPNLNRQPAAPDPEILPHAIRELARQCFVTGRLDVRRRPSARTWHEELVEFGRSLKSCSTNSNHRYREGLSECPWCAQFARQGRDPFPIGARDPSSDATGAPADEQRHTEVAAVDQSPRQPRPDDGPQKGVSDSGRSRRRSRRFIARGLVGILALASVGLVAVKSGLGRHEVPPTGLRVGQCVNFTALPGAAWPLTTIMPDPCQSSVVTFRVESISKSSMACGESETYTHTSWSIGKGFTICLGRLYRPGQCMTESASKAVLTGLAVPCSMKASAAYPKVFRLTRVLGHGGACPRKTYEWVVDEHTKGSVCAVILRQHK